MMGPYARGSAECSLGRSERVRVVGPDPGELTDEDDERLVDRV